MARGNSKISILILIFFWMGCSSTEFAERAGKLSSDSSGGDSSKNRLGTSNDLDQNGGDSGDLMSGGEGDSDSGDGQDGQDSGNGSGSGNGNGNGNGNGSNSDSDNDLGNQSGTGGGADGDSDIDLNAGEKDADGNLIIEEDELGIDQSILDGPGVTTSKVAVNFELFPGGGDMDYDDITFCFEADEEVIKVNGNEILVAKNVELKFDLSFASDGNKRIEVRAGSDVLYEKSVPNAVIYADFPDQTVSLKKGDELVVLGTYGVDFLSNSPSSNVRISATCNN